LIILVDNLRFDNQFLPLGLEFYVEQEVRHIGGLCTLDFHHV